MFLVKIILDILKKNTGASIIAYHNNHLQGSHPTRMPIWVLAAPLLIQLLDKVPGKAVEDGPGPWNPVPTWKTSFGLVQL